MAAQAKEKEEKKELDENSKKGSYDYRTCNFKLSDNFKNEFIIEIKGKPAIKADGLTILGHIKGMWAFKTDVIQYPNQENGNTCICRTFIGGYDWDPIEQKICKVEYEDIADANPSNCTKMVASAFIRMASTRSQARALRKYTNYDMLCAEELYDGDVFVDGNDKSPAIDMAMLNNIKQIVTQKQINESQFNNIMSSLFGSTNIQSLSMNDGQRLLSVLKDYIPPQ